MVVKRVLLICVLGSLMLTVYGCAPTFISTEAGVYSGGTLYAVSEKDMTSVYQATLAALNELEVEITDKAKDVFYAKVLAKGADGKLVKVSIKPGEDKLTHYSIKVGVMGNKHRSRVVYEKIQQKLGYKATK